MRCGAFLTTLFVAWVFFTATNTGFTKEPPNFELSKTQIRRYHDSGEYYRDFNRVMDRALNDLKQYTKHRPASDKKPAIILDIDETSLSNYPDLNRLDFGGTAEEVRQYQNKGKDAAFGSTLALYRFARAQQIAIIFLTGRDEGERHATIRNLKQVGYDQWNALIFRDGPYKTVPAAVYKTAMRKKLVKEGYDIILNIGDQYSDLRGEDAGKTFKLPNPFYFIP